MHTHKRDPIRLEKVWQSDEEENLRSMLAVETQANPVLAPFGSKR
jgi:hypothetical protein